jgi:uncharacterized membrane protein YphA (DoxX/SURF4 family)
MRCGPAYAYGCRATADWPAIRATSKEAVHVNTSRIKAAGRIAAVWIPTLFLVFVFAPQAWNKLSDTGGWAIAFRHWGYPTWFRITIGFAETLAALLLLWHRTAILGAAVIIGIMLGGTGTHIVKDHGRHVTSEVLPITLATVVLVLRLRAARRTNATAHQER